MNNCIIIIAGSLRNDFGTTTFIVCFSSSNLLSCQRWPQVGSTLSPVTHLMLLCDSVVLSILAAEQKEIVPEHKEEAAGKASSGKGSEQQKHTESISESFHAESDLQVRSCCCNLSDVSAKWLIDIAIL